MRLVNVLVGGKEYPACFSGRLMLELEQDGKSIQEKLGQIAEGGRMSDLLPLLHSMIVSGHRYAERHGITNPGELSFDDFIDEIGADDFDSLFGAAVNVIKETGKTTVEAEAPKNAGGTRGAET